MNRHHWSASAGSLRCVAGIISAYDVIISSWSVQMSVRHIVSAHRSLSNCLQREGHIGVVCQQRIAIAPFDYHAHA